MDLFIEENSLTGEEKLFKSTNNAFSMRILLPLLFFLPTGAFGQLAPAQIRETIASGNPDLAIEQCEESLRTNMVTNERFETIYLLGEAQRESEKPDDAIRTWSRLQRETGVPEAWHIQAVLAQADLWGKNNNTEKRALENYRGVIRRWPRGEFTPDAVIGAMRLLRKQGSLDEALRQLDAWRPEFETHALATIAKEERVELENVLAKIKTKKPQPPAEAKIAEAEKLKISGKYADAIRAYTNALSLTSSGTPEHWTSQQGLVECWYASGERDKALKAAQALISNTRTPAQVRAQALVTTGKIMLENGDNGVKAERIFKQAISSRPDEKILTDAKRNLALALARQGKTAEASTLISENENSQINDDAFTASGRLQDWTATGKIQYEDVLGGQKSNNALLRSGDDFFAMLDYGNAAKAYAAARDEARSTEDAAYCLFQEARSLAFSRDYKKAISRYQRFVTDIKFRNSKWAAPALLRAGIMCIGPMNDEKTGFKFFSDVIKFHPKSGEAIEARYNTGRIHHWKGRWNKAVEEYEKLLADFPQSSYAELTRQHRDAAKNKKQTLSSGK